MSVNVSLSFKSNLRRAGWALGIVLLVSSIIGISAFAQIKRSAKGEVWGYKVVATYLATGKVEKIAPLNSHYFGEGITALNDRIYQLTWQNRVGVVYNRETFDIETTFQYTGEGWGLTNDGHHLVMSDGSATIRFLDPKSFEVVKRITAHNSRGKVDKLNELEYVNDEIWANVWYDDRIVRISPENGEVLGWIDLGNLYPRHQRSSNEDVLNGIAYDSEHQRLFVTGKNWPRLYEITVGQK
jgi:glutamine cyclotransferase